MYSDSGVCSKDGSKARISIGSGSLSCSRDSGMLVPEGLDVSTASMDCRNPLTDFGPGVSKSLWGVGGLVGLPVRAETS